MNDDLGAPAFMIPDIKDVQRWMRTLNIPKEEKLLEALHKFGPSAEMVALGLERIAANVG